MNPRDYVETQSGRSESDEPGIAFDDLAVPGRSVIDPDDDVIGDDSDDARQREWDTAWGVASLANNLGGGVVDIWLPGAGKEAAKLVDKGLLKAREEQIKKNQPAIVVEVQREGEKLYGVIPLPREMSKAQLAALERAKADLAKAQVRRDAAKGKKRS